MECVGCKQRFYSLLEEGKRCNSCEQDNRRCVGAVLHNLAKAAAIAEYQGRLDWVEAIEKASAKIKASVA